MSQQFDRVCSLTVGDPTGEALDLSALHIRFGIINGDTQTPKTANIRVYNVAPETAARIRKEFTQVLLQAGYVGNAGTIFAGQIRQVRIGRENATDTFIDILAADGDVAYLHAKLNTTLAAGYTPEDLRSACLKAMQPFGVVAGELAALPSTRSPRGRPLYGLAREFLRELADTYGMSWQVSLGQLHMIPVDTPLTGSAIELTSDSGLVGMPQQTLDGIMVKCLINPQIKAGRQIRLNNRSIQEAAISTSAGYLDQRPKYDTDGFYKVWAVAINGDTRGQDWTMDLVCTGIDGTLPKTPAFVQLRGIYGS